MIVFSDMILEMVVIFKATRIKKNRIWICSQSEREGELTEGSKNERQAQNIKDISNQRAISQGDCINLKYS